MLKYVYFGTPEISKNVLEDLVKIYGKPELVITAPDAPKGRKLVLTASPVKEYSELNQIKLLAPNKLIEIKAELENASCQIAVLFAYGKIIPKWLLDLFPYGIINVHPSLLPLYRGASPLTGPILNGDTATGITIMDMDIELDHGDIYLQDKIEINSDTNREDLEKYVSLNSAKLLKEVMDKIESGTQNKTPQDHALATYTTKIKKEDGELKDTDTDEIKYRKYRAYIGWPGTYFYQNSKRVKITKAHMANGTFVIDSVIPENGKEIKCSEFLTNNSL